MIITAIAYNNVEETTLKVTTSDMGILTIPKLAAGNPNRTWHNDVVDKWEGTITAFVDPVDYMAKLRGVRDQKIAAIYWRVERNITQVANSETPTDSDMSDIYDYLKALRDFPANNPITTLAQYEALTWPTLE